MATGNERIPFDIELPPEQRSDYKAPDAPAPARPIDDLKAAGFSDDEISGWTTQKRAELKTAGFEDHEIDGYMTGGVATPAKPSEGFIRRLQNGNAFDRIGESMYQGAKKGYGADEALGLSQETADQMAKLGVFNDPAQPTFSKQKGVVQNGISGLRLFNEALIRPAAQALDFTARIFNAGIGEVAGGFGQAVTEVSGNEAQGARAERDVNIMGQMAAIADGMNVSRIQHDPITNTVHDQPIGGLPKAQDFSNAAKAVAGDAHPVATQEKLLKLYEDHGIHPAEVATDAQKDPTIAHSLLSSDAADLPARYVPPKPEPSQIASKAQERASPETLTRFLASKGGIKATPELQQIFDSKNPFVPGYGRLFRKDGMELDYAREAAVQEGFMRDANAETGLPDTTTTNELLGLLDNEARGQKVYRLGKEPAADLVPKTDIANEADHQAKLSSELDQAFSEAGYDPASIPAKERERTLQIMQREGIDDPLDAHERAVMEGMEDVNDAVGQKHAPEEIPGWDFPDDAGAAPADGGQPAEVGASGASGKSRAGGEDARAPAEQKQKPAELEAQQIRDDISSQLQEAGRPADEADKAAAITASRYKARAERFGNGVTPLELYQAEGLKIRKGDQLEIPGAQKIGDGELAQRKADEPLKGKVAQNRNMDEGLFSDSSQQKVLFQEGRENAPPFFSAVEKAVTDAKQEKASAAQWLGTLKNTPGVKAEELKWLGLEDWLAEQKGNVTKAQVQDYVRANQIEVKEIAKGEGADPALVAEYNALKEQYRQGDLTDAELKRFYELGNIKSSDVRETKYHGYQTPGGENYKELLLTLPEKKGNAGPKGWGDTAGGTADNANFRSPHFDEPNVVAHVRFNDRTIGGKKTLFVEEVQSDWHQTGKRKGYKDENADAEYKQAIEDFNEVDDRLKSLWRTVSDQEPGTPLFEKLKENVLKAQAEHNAAKIRMREAGAAAHAVPDAPFKTTWPELAMKRMIRYAAEEGYDKISWTSGDMQAARYDLSKQVDQIITRPVESGNGTLNVYAFDKDGRKINIKSDAKPAELPDLIGKDLAEKAQKFHAENPTNEGVWAGVDLQVGGEGMKGFYDKILPSTVNKLVKKYGVKVEKGALSYERNAGDAYIGPEPTQAQIEQVLEHVMARPTDQRFVSPVTGERMRLQINRVSNESAIRDVGRAMDEGEDFEEAMSKHGNQDLAEIFGGKMELQKQTDTEAVHALDIPKELKADVLEKGQPLFQSAPTGSGPRGRITLDDNKAVIDLFQKADSSTFMHEAGHLWLDELVRDGLHPDAPAALKADLDETLKWLGVDKAEGIGVAHHEKWAKGFEQYLATGKAPSTALAKAFEGFKNWLLDIYKSIKDIGEPLPEQIRGVMDRLIATDEEIKTSLKEANEKILNRIDVGGGERKPFEFKRAIHKFYTDFKDALHPINQAVKAAGGKDLPASQNPYTLARLSRGAYGRAEQMLTKGTFDYGTYEKTGKGLQQILDKIENMDDFRSYVTSKRAIELEARGVKSGLTPEELGAANKIANSNFNKIHYEDAMKDLVSYQTRVLAYMRDSGVLSKEAFDTMRAANKDYVPFFRVMDEQQKQLGPGKGLVASNPIKKIKGSDRDIVDPLEGVIKNTYLYTAMAEKNRIGEAFLKMADDTGEAAQFYEKVPSTIKPTTVQADEMQKFFKKHGIENPPEDLLTVFRATQTPLAADEIAVFRNGKREVYKVDPDLAEAFKNLDQQSIGFLTKILAKPASALRAGATMTPDFMAKNIIRDFQTAFINSKGFFSPIDTIKGAKGYLKKDLDFEDWMKSGGANATLVSIDRRYVQANLEKLTAETGLGNRALNVIKHPWDSMRAVSELFENATRLGEFKKVMRQEEAKGASRIDASMAAGFSSREVTLDFARIGAKMQGINLTRAFLNANLEGTDRILRQFKDRPLNTMAKVAALPVAASMLFWWANHDDPRYKAMHQWEKDLFWPVITDKWEDTTPSQAAALPDYLVRRTPDGRLQQNNGHIFRIPKDFSIGVVFGSGTERALDAFFSKNPDAYEEFATSIAQSIIPNVVPTWAQPMLEEYSNKSALTGSKVIPASLEKFLPEYQYTPYTTELSKKLAQVVSAFPGMRDAAVSGDPTGLAKALTTPILIENYVRAWTGGTGAYALQAADLALRKVGVLPDPIKPTATLADIPFIKAFVVRYPSASTQNIDDFYSAYGRDKVYFDTFMAKAKDGDVDAMQRIQAAGGPRIFVQLDAFKTVLSQHQQLIQDIYKHPTMPGPEKRQLIDGLYYSMIKIGDNAKAMTEQLDQALTKKH